MNKMRVLSAAILTTTGFCSGLAAAHLHNHAGTQAAQSSQSAPIPGALAHVKSEFSFTVHAPMAVAAPLFGPEAERSWGGSDWNPHFLYPQPVKDVDGAVFQVQHGQHASTWVTTALDFARGHVQYVNIIDGLMATKIDIRLTPKGPENTFVTVVYERTALKPEANDHVNMLGQNDSESGQHWGSFIDGYLKTQPQKK